MKLPWGMREDDPRCLEMRSWIREQIEFFYQKGYTDFICGMAIGCDMYFAEEVLSLRPEHPDIKLHAAIPCADQSSRWNRAQKQKYEELLSQCDGKNTFVENYTPDCMQFRNEYMVNESSALIACYNGRPGGTMATIAMAAREGLEMKILDISEIK